LSNTSLLIHKLFVDNNFILINDVESQCTYSLGAKASKINSKIMDSDFFALLVLLDSSNSIKLVKELDNSTLLNNDPKFNSNIRKKRNNLRTGFEARNYSTFNPNGDLNLVQHFIVYKDRLISI
jgi:hypothetical protein